MIKHVLMYMFIAQLFCISTDADVAMLNRRVLGNSVSITSIKDAPIITQVNETVMAINDLFVHNQSRHTKVYVSTAVDRIGKNGKVPKDVAKIYKKWANTKTDQLPRQLKLFVGMPVSVTTNIKTELGITNGTKGVIKSIHLKNGEVIDSESGINFLKEQPEYIIVELDDVDLKQLRGLPLNCVPIEPCKGYFQVKKPGRKKKVSINRKNFPLVPLFSCTAHKSQGQTLSKAIVDLVPTGKPKGVEFAYVPLSRVRKLEDLTILRPFNPSVLKTKVNEACVAMMEEFKSRDLCRDIDDSDSSVDDASNVTIDTNVDRNDDVTLHHHDDDNISAEDAYYNDLHYYDELHEEIYAEDSIMETGDVTRERTENSTQIHSENDGDELQNEHTAEEDAYYKELEYYDELHNECNVDDSIMSAPDTSEETTGSSTQIHSERDNDEVQNGSVTAEDDYYNEMQHYNELFDECSYGE